MSLYHRWIVNPETGKPNWTKVIGLTVLVSLCIGVVVYMSLTSTKETDPYKMRADELGEHLVHLAEQVDGNFTEENWTAWLNGIDIFNERFAGKMVEVREADRAEQSISKAESIATAAAKRFVADRNTALNAVVSDLQSGSYDIEQLRHRRSQWASTYEWSLSVKTLADDGSIKRTLAEIDQALGE